MRDLTAGREAWRVSISSWSPPGHPGPPATARDRCGRIYGVQTLDDGLALRAAPERDRPAGRRSSGPATSAWNWPRPVRLGRGHHRRRNAPGPAAGRTWTWAAPIATAMEGYGWRCGWRRPSPAS
ncbi:hypothetical protein QJS66_19610 [Kocuria rhizophila]|nr:hypothetical protein QJS66_19610 [Kocuria rhizophila]